MQRRKIVYPEAPLGTGDGIGVLRIALHKQLIDLVRNGQKIEAIRLYRLQTGTGLKEAKDYVDSL